MRLFVATEYLKLQDADVEDAPVHVVFTLIGVFDTEEAAREACTLPYHGYGPLRLNERLPDGPNEWPGFVYPIAESA